MKRNIEKNLSSKRGLAALLAAVVLIVCVAGVVLWHLKPMSLEEMTANMPEDPSEEWMRQYVNCAYESEEFWDCIVPWNGHPDLNDWWDWFYSLPLAAEDGGGQFFYIKWMWAVPHQYPDYQGISHEEFKKTCEELPSEDYMRYFVERYCTDTSVQKRVSYWEEDAQAWWDWFHSLPLYDANLTNQYGIASTDVLTPPDAGYSGWRGVHSKKAY